MRQRAWSKAEAEDWSRAEQSECRGLNLLFLATEWCSKKKKQQHLTEAFVPAPLLTHSYSEGTGSREGEAEKESDRERERQRE